MGWSEDLERVVTAAEAPGAAERALASSELLASAIDADRDAGLFARWGRAAAPSDDAGEPLLRRAVFEALHSRAGLEAAWPVGNAGLLRTYGDPLAAAAHGTTAEPGRSPALARALGLDDARFAPDGDSGTLLARATDAASVLLASGGEFSWYALVDGRATRTVLGPARGGARALAYAVAPTPGYAPLLVALFPITDAEPVRRELDEASARLRWGAV
ncbi:hypothetical protein [Microbacterium azadirachtae]|uniref:hypothetical protein n=1 Tax=Microbacterium azadirachtae TaxID=582680 RepID=UPI00087E7A68|nr:hypothetical protein [Microbacterium azadirachtae]SDM39062.1 hypothetical protein SAMN04488593_3437 [Microbacterium azadirachtae]SEG54462.1 hypothetical protein SAMN04488594_3422 [Microbacterium azadirachtae]SEG57360.1 hypothetical protein SAMN04488592_3432 [Microbacterium azadirachtae]